MKDTEKKNEKKGLWALIKESMTKTGGCCGSGGDCCGGAKKEPDTKKCEQPKKNGS